MQKPSATELSNKKQLDQQRSNRPAGSTEKKDSTKTKDKEADTSKTSKITDKLPQVKDVSTLQHFFMFLLLIFAAFIDIIDWIPLATDVIDWALDIMLWVAIFFIVLAFQGLGASIFIRSTVINSLGFIAQIIPVVDTFPGAITAVVLIWLDMQFGIFEIVNASKNLTKGSPST